MRYKRLVDCPEGMRKLLEKQLAPDPLKVTAKRPKYGNVRTQYNGETFDSKAEAAEDQALRMAEAAGEIAGYARQVSIPMRARKGRRMQLDFMVNAKKSYACAQCGHLNHIHALVLRDKKGFVTREWQTKRRILEAQLGIEIEVV